MSDRRVSRPWRGQLSAIAGSPLVLWAAFLLVHFWLSHAPLRPLGDLELYRRWVADGITHGHWVGLDTSWVYPIGALVPMLPPSLGGAADYADLWFLQASIVDAIAFLVLIGLRGRRSSAAAWWWLAFLFLLGPIALARLDSIVAALAIIALVVVASRPLLAGALLAAAAWIKAWPAVLLVAVLVAVRRRLRLVIGAAITTGVLVLADLVVGDLRELLGFVGAQTSRGLQIEAPLATFFLWNAAAGGSSSVAWNTELLTFQVRGPGVAAVAAWSTPLMAVVVGALLVVGVVLARRGVPAVRLLVPLALAVTSSLIVFNKVGSPQYATWLAAPLVFALVVAARGERVSSRAPAVVALVLAGLTQVIYPYYYELLVALSPALLLALTVRNALYVVLMVLAVRELVLLFRRANAVVGFPQPVAASLTP